MRFTDEPIVMMLAALWPVFKVCPLFYRRIVDVIRLFMEPILGAGVGVSSEIVSLTEVMSSW